jgi:hypothetical protein
MLQPTGRKGCDLAICRKYCTVTAGVSREIKLFVCSFVLSAIFGGHMPEFEVMVNHRIPAAGTVACLTSQRIVRVFRFLYGNKMTQ